MRAPGLDRQPHILLVLLCSCCVASDELLHALGLRALTCSPGDLLPTSEGC